MKFLEISQICEWAEENGLDRGAAFEVRLPDLQPRLRRKYADGHRSGREKTASQELVNDLGVWDEYLVWITERGVWPSGENWPRFYGWRGALGEARSLSVSPGQLFGHEETLLLGELIELIMENAWDAHVFCSRQSRADGVCAKISHDEWYQIFG